MELRGYETLLSALGVPKEFSPANFVEVLQKIEAKAGGRPLDADTLATAVGTYVYVRSPRSSAPRGALPSVTVVAFWRVRFGLPHGLAAVGREGYPPIVGGGSCSKRAASLWNTAVYFVVWRAGSRDQRFRLPPSFTAAAAAAGADDDSYLVTLEPSPSVLLPSS